MPKKVLLFAPCAFNLAETSRMVEIAKGIKGHSRASQMFDVHFISDGGDFESLIEKHGFPLTRMEPRLTPEKIEHIAKVDRGEKFAPAFADHEMIQRVENEITCLKKVKPVAVVTGSYVTIPVTCRVLGIPLVWVVQSTWLPDFFSHGAGMTDNIRPASFKTLVDWFVLRFINFWIRYGFLNPVNRTARHFGVPGYDSIFEFWSGDITLVAEPPEFTGIELPENHYFIGPLIPQEEFPLPPEVAGIPKDKPLIYFAMGSSGTPDIVARIVESFAGKPYYVMAPIKFQLAKIRGVRVPTNVMVTDWVPALQVNKMVDLAVIHGGIGTVMTAALAGKPVVGVGMQMEQVANLAALERLGFAIRVPKSRNPSARVQSAIQRLMHDEAAKAKAVAFSRVIAQWDGPSIAAEKLLERYGVSREDSDLGRENHQTQRELTHTFDISNPWVSNGAVYKTVFSENHKATKGDSPMKRSLTWCLLGLILLVSSAWAQANKGGGTEQAVAALEQKWLQGQKTNNPDLIAPMLADKFVDTGSDGKVTDKTASMAMAKKMKYTSAEYEDVKVAVFGDTAIATGGFKGKGTDASGKPFDTHERWTDTWVKMPNGQWQCVATQATPIKM